MSSAFNNNANLNSEQVASSLYRKWGWFILLGIVMLMLGGIAFGNLLFATVVSVYYVGAIILIAGIAQVIHAFSLKSWKSFIFWVLSGLLYIVAGIFCFINPLLASTVLTFFLAVALIASGLLRIWVGFESRPVKGYGWIILGGLITALAGAIIAMRWPVDSLWILGMFLAIDLVFQGWTVIAFGFGLKQAGGR